MTSILAPSLLSDLNKKLLYSHFIIPIQNLYLYGPGDHVKSLQNMGYLKLQNADEDGAPSDSAARRTEEAALMSFQFVICPWVIAKPEARTSLSR